jgi:hypothetical protein
MTTPSVILKIMMGHKRTENQTHSRTIALKNAVREIAKEDIRTNENREINRNASNDILLDTVMLCLITLTHHRKNFLISQSDLFV